MHCGSVSGYNASMLTKILTAIAGLIIALMVLRFFAERAHRAQIKERVKARRRTEAEPDTGPHVRSESAPGSKPNMITTLEVDPDTGVYRPKG